MPVASACGEEAKGKRRFAGGQRVPVDGVYADVWGGRLPLLEGDLFPVDPVMGDSKWTFAGPLTDGLPAVKRAGRTAPPARPA